jgi:hypothetical protein
MDGDGHRRRSRAFSVLFGALAEILNRGSCQDEVFLRAGPATVVSHHDGCGGEHRNGPCTFGPPAGERNLLPALLVMMDKVRHACVTLGERRSQEAPLPPTGARSSSICSLRANVPRDPE